MITNKWNFEGDCNDYVGFIYKVTFPSGMFYIGRKQFHSTTRKRIVGKTRRKVTVKESDWRKYNTSSVHVKELLNTQSPKWEILHLCTSKRDMQYYEAKCLWAVDALRNNQCLNREIPKANR